MLSQSSKTFVIRSFFFEKWLLTHVFGGSQGQKFSCKQACVELLTMGLTTIWFAGGALAALLMSVLGFGMPVQVVVFIIVSVLLLVLTRPIAVKYFNQNRQKTNVESLIGQQALVLEDVDTLHASGQVKVNGQIWSAKTEEMSGFIAKDTVVMIQGIQGVKLIVKAKED